MRERVRVCVSVSVCARLRALRGAPGEQDLERAPFPLFFALPYCYLWRHLDLERQEEEVEKEEKGGLRGGGARQ